MPAALLSLPNKRYWLAPERVAQTRAWLVDQCAGYGILLCVFLCYVHTLVVRAHASTPPHLDERLMPWPSRPPATSTQALPFQAAI